MTRQDLLAWRQGKVIDPLDLDYQQRLFAGDHLALVFPVWWEAMPDATKGFLDRVLTKGSGTGPPGSLDNKTCAVNATDFRKQRSC